MQECSRTAESVKPALHDVQSASAQQEKARVRLSMIPQHLMLAAVPWQKASGAPQTLDLADLAVPTAARGALRHMDGAIGRSP